VAVSVVAERGEGADSGVVAARGEGGGFLQVRIPAELRGRLEGVAEGLRGRDPMRRAVPLGAVAIRAIEVGLAEMGRVRTGAAVPARAEAGAGRGGGK
jgi:hypothetical protein